MKKIFPIVLPLFSSCGSIPYISTQEYRDLKYEHCINTFPEDQREQKTGTCALQSVSQVAVPEKLYKQTEAESDLRECSGHNVTVEKTNDCFAQKQRDYYERWFKLPSRDAELIRLDEVYEINLPSGWQVQQMSAPIRRVYEVDQSVAPNHLNLNTQSDLRFVAKKDSGDEWYQLRIITIAPSLPNRALDSLATTELEALKNKHIADAKTKYESANMKLLSSKADKASFEGNSALRLETVIQADNGNKYLDIEYTVYQTAATVTIGASQYLKSGDFNRENSEKLLSSITFLAQ